LIALDSNIVLYAIDHTSGPRHLVARDIVKEAALSGGIVPMQVLAEMLAVVHRKMPALRSIANEAFDGIMSSCIVPETNAQHLRDAFIIAARYQLQFFDSLILTVAAAAGATTLYSEDMQDGLTIGQLAIRTPFSQPA